MLIGIQQHRKSREVAKHLSERYKDIGFDSVRIIGFQDPLMRLLKILTKESYKDVDNGTLKKQTFPFYNVTRKLMGSKRSKPVTYETVAQKFNLFFKNEFGGEIFVPNMKNSLSSEISIIPDIESPEELKFVKENGIFISTSGDYNADYSLTSLEDLDVMKAMSFMIADKIIETEEIAPLQPKLF